MHDAEATGRAVASAATGVTAGGGPGGGGRPADRGGPRWRPPPRVDVIERLDGAGLLPAITFIFSRAGCDAAVAQCVRSGMRLTTEKEREEIRQIVDRRTVDLAEADLGVLGYWEWREALERGIAAHHAGLLPVFKETVEELFVAGLVKAVFATETLALGINMPARTVVLEKLSKYNGEGHADLTAGEYTQLTGRAGRRGIDVEGHAVVVWAPGMDPRVGRRSGVPADLSTAVLVPAQLQHGGQPGGPARPGGRPRPAGTVVRAVPGQRRGGRAGPSGHPQRRGPGLPRSKAMQCHLGDTASYLALLNELAAAEKEIARAGASRRRDETARDLAGLRRGDVIEVPTGRRAGLAVVLDPGVATDGSLAAAGGHRRAVGPAG